MRLGKVAAAPGQQQRAEQFQRLPAARIGQLTQHRQRSICGHTAQGVLQVLQALPRTIMFRVCSAPFSEATLLFLVQLATPLQHQPMAGLLDDGRGDGRFAGGFHSAYST
ncbi:hypothetical protein D3C80_1131640 [compost metagenome]